MLILLLICATQAYNLEDTFYSNYNQVDSEYISVRLSAGSYTAQLTSGCDSNPCDVADCTCLRISVTHNSPENVIGCDMLLPYYKTTSDSYQNTLNPNTNIVARTTGQQAHLDRSSTDAKDWLVDAFNVQHFCRELAAERRIRRSLWEEYVHTTQTWAQTLLDKHGTSISNTQENIK